MILSRLERYISFYVLNSFVIVMIVLLGLVGLSIVLDELKDITEKYPFSSAVEYSLLSIPAMAYQLLPIGALIATLTGLGVLSSSSELVIMRASGLSMFQFVVSILKPVLLIAIFSLVLAEVVVPSAQHAALTLKSESRGGGALYDWREGSWFRERDSFIQVEAMTPNGELRGVVQHRFDDTKRMLERISADSAAYSHGKWQLYSVTRTTHSLSESRLGIDELDSLDWDTELTPELLKVVLVEPRYLPVSELSTFTSYLDEQGVDPKKYELAFWGKVLQPLSIVALVLVGTAFIFGPLRSVTVGQRILTGVVVGLVFKLSQDLLAPASQVLGFAAFWAALIPILVSLAFAGFMLARVR